MNELNKTPPVMETKLPARSDVLAVNLTSPPAHGREKVCNSQDEGRIEDERYLARRRLPVFSY